MTTTEITIKGAREHNLRDVSLKLPRGQMICFTGVSGSGKSSLAFDTLYAEGQRRYVESLSNYARQFMGQMPKPDVDLITGLSPAISISQKSTGSNPRSTVGTITEIYDFLRVIYARVGTGHCHHCGTLISAQTREQILSRVAQSSPEYPISVLAPLVRGQKGEFKDLFEDLRKQGFARARVDGTVYGLTEDIGLDRSRRHDVDVVIDRLTVENRVRGRLAEAVDAALRLGKGSMLVLVDEGETEQEILYSSHYSCTGCGRSFPPPTPQLFSFNSPQGMCEGCDGLGRLYTFVPELLIPDHRLSFRKGAIALVGDWSSLGKHRKHVYTSVAEAIEQKHDLAAGTMLKSAWKDLPSELQDLWLWGTGDLRIAFTWRGASKSKKKYFGTFHGVVSELLDRYRTAKNKMFLRSMEKYMDTMACPDCHGQRLNPQARAVTLKTKHADFQSSSEFSLPQLCTLSADKLANFFSELELPELSSHIAGEALKEIRTRIGFLLGVGLDYLSLDRTAPTLSGGESQRIRLAGQIGSGLSGVLYILDEPSIGLHARDNDRLIDTLLTLRDRGNTLIVVEHDEDTMRASDLMVDFGPGPGVRGGKVVARGSVEDVAAESKSVTGQYLAGKARIEVPKKLRAGTGENLTIYGAQHNNLKNIDVSFPLGKLICVTGVSGSGKSSLIGDILEPALRQALNGAEVEPGEHLKIDGLEHLDKTIAIDQSPIGRTPRSNPGTYVKVFDEIRNLFAQMQDAKTRGYSSSRFSFNVDGGRCSACEGNGATKLEMDFLADIWMTCPVCEGHRYNRETLAVKFKQKSIADVLEMDVSEALKLFSNIPKVASQLQTLVDVGLEYLKLGQPSPTLSGGEAQRIKLSRELSKRSTGRTLYVLDEPTTGLHFADIKLLLGVLHDLVDKGNTVVVVEHNLDVIKTADWVIDLGPEGGEGGGQLVVAGTPQEIAACGASYTGRALARTLGLSKEKAHTKNRIKKFAAVSATESDVDPRRLIVEGASEHNLKSVNVSLPRDAMTVFCGPSGSGKSSLAMDTIYAEGQRRYVESLSSYARQFIGQMQKPHAERIEGLSPAVALEQKNLGHSPRSTVGTVTEIYDYFRILLARMGTMYCPDCQIPVGTQTADQVVDKVLAMEEGIRFLLLAPLKRDPGQDPTEIWNSLRENGYSRIRVDGVTTSLDEAPQLDPRRTYQLQVVVDRLILRSDDQMRITDSVEQALSLGSGVIQIAVADNARPEQQWDVFTHSQHLACGCCGRSFQPLSPHHFSFNTSAGWCEQCEGLGIQNGTNPAALLKSSRATLAEGALLLWPELHRSMARAMMWAFARSSGIPLDVPFDNLPILQRRKIYHGTGDRWIEVSPNDYEESALLGGQPAEDADFKPFAFRFQFKGLYPALGEASRLNATLRAKLDRFVDQIECSACDGTRLKDVASSVRYENHTIGDFVRTPLGQLFESCRSWKLNARSRKVAGELIREIRDRLQFLLDVGLEYLTLGRAAATLSGGEAQRIRLAAQLGSGLCGVLYVLDEPTIGLHPRDNRRLLGALHRLRDLGNTLLVVEHDFDVIAGSDYLCDFGPKAGRHGGEVVAQGPPKDLQPLSRSVTAPYLLGTKGIAVPTNRRILDEQPVKQYLEIVDASENNLQNVTVKIPLGTFTAITGPSGSGKSTLINGILYPALARRLHRAALRPGRHGDIRFSGAIDKVIRVDQSPLGNTPSSNPATYTGVFDLIRLLFAKLPESQQRGYTARNFSFNVPGGRCEACEGTGQKKIEMHFLPDVWIQCEDCHGKRYMPETLEARYHGHSIADVLDMACGDALRLFESQPKIAKILQTICDVGLEYVTLGQSAPTLSGGEAQRVKLAAELARPDTGKTLYLLDEPTTGLHFDDIAKLLIVLQQLVNLGNTVVVIEHNQDVIKTVDWIIDMGPEAGREGGKVVCEGTPEYVAQYAGQVLQEIKKTKRKAAKDEDSDSAPLRSYTGEFLGPVLKAGPHESQTLQQPAKSVPVPVKTAKVEEQVVDKRQVATVEPSLDQKPGWEVDGRAWHLQDPRDRKGSPVKWDSQCIGLLMERLEDCQQFESFDFQHYSRIQVSKPKNSNVKRAYWFMNAFSCESLWLKCKFRLPKGTFAAAQLIESMNLPTLNQMNIVGAYSNEQRVRVSSTGRFQEVEVRFFHKEEIESEPFQHFLNVAIDAYCGLANEKRVVLSAKQVSSQDQVSAQVDVAPARHLWQALGRRWHSLAKGFPEGSGPSWPLKMADETLGLFEKISGAAALHYETADTVTVRPVPEKDPWAIVETKKPGHLSVAVQGPADAIDLGSLEQMQTKGTLDVNSNGDSRITFHFTDPKQLANQHFHAFLKAHLEKTFEQT